MNETEREPYFIEVDTSGCQHCGAKRTWTIVGPDDVAIGRSFEDEETARDLAADMNTAYYAGRASAMLNIDKPCPVCPDGYVWDSNGPTSRACPVCNGYAVVHLDGSPIGPRRK